MEEDESPKEQPKNTIQCLDKKEKACLIYCSSCVFVFYSKDSFDSCHNIFCLDVQKMNSGIILWEPI